MDKDYIALNYPLGWSYLQRNKKDLEGREKGKMKGDRFYAYIYPKNLADFEAIKIMTPEIALRCQMSIDTTGLLYHTTTIYSFRFNKDRKENPYYFLGILNSNLLWVFLTQTGYILRGNYFRFKTDYLKPFPIKTLDFTKTMDREQHDKMVSLVDRMLTLNKELPLAKTPNDKTRIERQLSTTDKEIDKLVYELYGLTEEEIKIVESN